MKANDNKPESKSSNRFPLESVGGAIPLDSNFYIRRQVDKQISEAIDAHESTILIRGARQVGKTSLLARGLAEARKAGCQIVLTDFQKLNSSYLESLSDFYQTLGQTIADRLDLDNWPEDVWDDRLSPNANFEKYFKDQVLGTFEGHFVWAMDEVDRIFTSPFSSEVFALFRSWHNERALDPDSPWHRLSLIISYATEAALFISDINMSPFNIGVRLQLEDFNESQVEELNQRHGCPLNTSGDVQQFYKLTGGQPYLTRRSFQEMLTKEESFTDFSSHLSEEEHLFDDHLKRIILLLTKDGQLLSALNRWLDGTEKLDPTSQKRLQQGGLLKMVNQNQVELRCGLYLTYLRQHLASFSTR
jgi:hypothetical protein